MGRCVRGLQVAVDQLKLIGILVDWIDVPLQLLEIGVEFVL